MYLNCKTYFSFRYGVLSAEELVALSSELGIQSLALTNINSTCDHWDFYKSCEEHKIKPVLGVEIRNEDDFKYVLLAKNRFGLKEINEFLSYHLQQKLLFPTRCSFTANVWVIYKLGLIETSDLEINELIGVRINEINKLFGIKRTPNKYVLLQPVTFKDKSGYNLHRLLRAIDKNIILTKQSLKEVANPDEIILPPSSLLQKFQNYPDVIMNTLKIIESCSYDFDFKEHKNKKVFSASAEDDKKLLEKLAIEGMIKRYGPNNKLAEERVRKELKIIHQLGFNAYFLITWDIIRYAQSRGFFYIGRGSGGNSIVAYCLRITDVNPIELDLYFERFLNPHRASPPDFDMDFSHSDRDEVIDYIFKRYGKDHVALLGMYSTFKWDASVRELGKVFGLPKHEIDHLLNNPKSTYTEDKIQRQIAHYATQMQRFPNYLSIHPGGMLISDQPITQFTVLELPPKGFATSQIDMFVAEDISLFKIDILSQRGLGHIRETLELVSANKNISIDIHAIEQFKKDEKVAAQIRNADTIGCFYIESPAMRQLLKKLRCDDYLTLVAASSIIRPGVAQSGMMREYIYRFHNPGKFEYLHPKMEELLKETYGVMVYQEDVIKVAHHFAGLDMGEADILRRAMSGKYRGNNQMIRIKNQFFLNCKQSGYPDAITSEVWRQIESFGGYSFSKAHSASFAVESYQSLYLKTYFPMEFMVAVINNEGGFYSRELYFHELKKTGAHIHPPCVNNSDVRTTISGNDVYVGFNRLKGLSTETIRIICEERKLNGPYTGLQEFIERTKIGMEQINILIRINAFRFIGESKKNLMWEANFLQRKVKKPEPVQELFKSPALTFQLPELEAASYEDIYDEIELLGFTLQDVFITADCDFSSFICSREFPVFKGKVVDVLGYLITTKYVTTKNRELMYFGTFIDKEGDWIDSVHFPQSVDKYPLEGSGFYHLRGKVTEEFDVYSIEVNWMKKIGRKALE